MSELFVSPVFLANRQAYLDDKVKIIVNQGGTRSGKTYSIMQLLCFLHKFSRQVTSVVSKTLPHIKKGCLRDFTDIMMKNGDYDDRHFNKTDLVYKFKGNNDSFMEFFSADDGAKLRGPGRDDLFINECNLLSYDEYMQLAMRTRHKIIIDYNPVDEFHWIYDKILSRDDVKFIQSCYLDNYDYLPKTQIEEIERLKEEDNNYWQVFGLGERAVSMNLIYPNFRIEHFQHKGDTIYGLDFGFNNPTALIKASVSGKNLYLEELIYESELTNSQLIKRLNDLIPKSFDYIYADAAEPDRIEEIYNAGFNIHKAEKNVKAGIDYIKRYNLIVHPDSLNLIKELKSYKWKEDRAGIILDEPVKFRDHLIDALRYAIFSHRQYLDILPGGSFPNIHLNNNYTRQNKYSQF